MTSGRVTSVSTIDLPNQRRRASSQARPRPKGKMSVVLSDAGAKRKADDLPFIGREPHQRCTTKPKRSKTSVAVEQISDELLCRGATFFDSFKIATG